LNNAVIKAQGVNFRGDLFRNIAVIGALIGAYFNINIIDPILAILAVIYAFYESIKIIRVSFNELIDYNAVDPDRIGKIKEYILSIQDVSSLEYFAMRTAGRKLEISVRLILQSEDFVTNSNEITNKIKKHVENEFHDYEINSFIEISLHEDGTSHPISSDIFEKIRQISTKFDLIQDIHHLSIDRLEEKVLIQFHVNVSQNESLNQVHSIVTQLEDNLKKSLSVSFLDVPIEILSHIEPIEKHDFSFTSSSLVKNEIIEKKITQIIEKLPEINDYKIINLLEESKGYFLSIIVYIEGEMLICNAHLIAELLEINLKQSVQEIHNCIIHTEPIKRKEN
jgi:divalent metal cation (Fe/Co/Zn/Cd) transporter